MIDFNKYDTEDRNQVTLLGYKLIQAMSDDALQDGRKLRLSTYGSAVHDLVKLRNSQAFKRSYIIGRKIANGEELNKGDSLIGGGDLARIISYVLSYDESHYPSFVETLKNEGGVFTELLELNSEKKYDPVIAAADALLARIDSKSPNLARQLIEIAKAVNTYETTLFDMSQKINQQNMTILRQSNENTQLNEDLRKAAEQFSRLEKLIQQTTDPKQKQNLIDHYNKYKKVFENNA